MNFRETLMGEKLRIVFGCVYWRGEGIKMIPLYIAHMIMANTVLSTFYDALLHPPIKNRKILNTLPAELSVYIFNKYFTRDKNADVEKILFILLDVLNRK